MNTKNYDIGKKDLVLPDLWPAKYRYFFIAFFAFTLIAVVPLDLNYLKQVLSINWGKFNYVDVDLLSNFYPWYVDAPFSDADGHSYYDLSLAILSSLIIALPFFYLDRKRNNYNTAYQWLKVIIRYKIAGVMLYFAFVKIFPVQMPFPTLSQMNTLLGDFTPGRLFWMATGAAPSYEIFTGIIELSAAILLLFRRTVVAGTFLLLIVLVQLVAINIGYDAGVQIKAILLTLLAIFLIWENIWRLWHFFFYNSTEQLVHSAGPILSKQWQKRARITLKTAFILLFVLFRGYSVATNYFSGKSFKLPSDKALPDLAGLYDVSTFSLNGKAIPYNPIDSNRWQNVVFEKWNTISIKKQQSILLQVSNKVRKTEIHSNVGRHYYAYEADTVQHTLHLTNRADKKDTYTLQYSYTPEGAISLKGIDSNQQQIMIELNKIEKPYPLIDGRHPKRYSSY